MLGFIGGDIGPQPPHRTGAPSRTGCPGAPVRESFVSPRGELDATALDHIEGLIGALSRTQTPQLEVKDGFELRLWVSDSTDADLEYEVCDLPVAMAAAA